MIHGVISADDFEIAVLFLTVLFGFGLWAGGGERDRGAVGRPGDGADAVILGGELGGLAAGGRDDIDLAFAVAVGGEGEAARIGRPLLPGGSLLAAGELVALAGGRDGDPDLGDEIVVVPIGLGDGIRHIAAVGRDLRAGDGFHSERFVDGGDGGAGGRAE